MDKDERDKVIQLGVENEPTDDPEISIACALIETVISTGEDDLNAVPDGFGWILTQLKGLTEQGARDLPRRIKRGRSGLTLADRMSKIRPGMTDIENRDELEARLKQLEAFEPYGIAAFAALGEICDEALAAWTLAGVNMDPPEGIEVDGNVQDALKGIMQGAGFGPVKKDDELSKMEVLAAGHRALLKAWNATPRDSEGDPTEYFDIIEGGIVIKPDGGPTPDAADLTA